MTDERPLDPVDYESTPLSRAEYISAIVHLYRGEMHRATVWRMRLDTTTNWAVLTTAGLLAFAFRTADNPHWPLLIGIMLIGLLMAYEARRYQVFDVWRARVRKIEENFYGPILMRDPVSPQTGWGDHVAKDLLAPVYKISFRGALRARFLRNYWAIFAVLLVSWILKVLMHPHPALSWLDVKVNMSTGLIPWWVPLAYIASGSVLFLYLSLIVKRAPQSDDEFWRDETKPGVGTEV